MQRRGGQQLRRLVRLHQWRTLKARPSVVIIILLGYPLVIASGFCVATLLWAVLGVWPPPPVATPLGQGFTAGVVLTGALWWLREMAQLLAAGAERERKGAIGEELTDDVLRTLRRRGWRVIHNIELPGKGNVDHLLVGPGGVIALDSKYTTERLWVTPKAIGGSYAKFISKAEWAAKLAREALAAAGHPGLEVEPALVFWGPGAPQIEGGYSTIQNTLVLDGRSHKKWCQALSERPHVLDRAIVKAVATDLERLAR